MSLAGFIETSFEFENITYPLFRRGEGPGVVIIHEIPGITPHVAEFGRTIADRGFSVALPSIFGTPGEPATNSYVLKQLARACISREIFVLSRRRSSPITKWLRALCRHVHQEKGGPGVGVGGMCLAGSFALSMMVDPVVMAPVLSQPSLPLPVSDKHKAALHLSKDELKRVKERVAEGVCVLGLRFTNDGMSPPQRFSRLRKELGDGFEGIEIDSAPGNPHQISKSAHSVLTADLVNEEGHPTREALERVVSFFQERLRE